MTRAAGRSRTPSWRALLLAVLLALGAVLGLAPQRAAADGPTTFANSTSVAIPATGSANQIGPASPYPSNISVSGMTGAVTKVTVTFSGLTHTTLNDVDAMVVAPSGANLVVLSDVGDPNQLVTASNANVTFDDSAAGVVPAQVNVPSGTYRPTDNDPGGATDSFPSPAPTPSSQTTLAGAFTGLSGADLNGTWSLYVVDDTSGDVGSMSGGWSLTITTDVAAASTTTTVTSSDTSSTTDQSVTFTAAVRAGGTPVTTGTVQFSVDGSDLGGPVRLTGSGTASLAYAGLSEGTHLIRATYSGATGFLPSNGTLSQRVDNATEVTGTTFCNTGAITGSSVASGAARPYPSNIFVTGLSGQVTKVTASLKGLSHTAPIDLDILLSGPTPATNVTLLSDAGGQNPVSDLTVDFDDGAAGAVPNPLVSGTFRPTDLDPNSQVDTFPAPAPAVSSATDLATFNGASGNGTWSLWVVDDASGDDGSIAGGWCLTITSQDPTSTTLSASPNPSTYGQTVTLRATVTAGGNPVTAGSVQFSDGGTDLGAPVSVATDGTATLTTDALTVGSHPITAAYGGTATLGESDDDVTQVVDQAASTTALISSLNPSQVGDSVTFTATVTAGGTPLTTGTVQFSDDGSDLGTPVALDAAGTATLTTDALTAGTHPITATYSGTASYATSDAALEQGVEKFATSTTLTSDPNPSTYGTAVTLTAEVTSGGSAIDTGSVQFSIDGATVGAPVPVDASGQATFTAPSDLAVGSHQLQAEFTGTAALASSTSDDREQVVQGLSTTTTVTTAPNPSDDGATVTFTATVTSGGTPLTTGDVQFSVDGVDVGAPVGLTGTGTASTSTADLAPGRHDVVATYLGDTTHETSTSPTASHLVNPVADAGGPYTVAEGGTLSLDASGSTAGASYAWDLDGDGGFDDATGATPSLTWDQLEALGIDDGPAAHTLRVRVTLNGGTAVAAADLTVDNNAPEAVVTGDLTATVGQPFTVKVGADDPSAADLAAQFTYTVDWGDGTPVEISTGPADPPVTHTYAVAGRYLSRFTATDKDGGTSGPTIVQVVAVLSVPTATPTVTTTATVTSRATTGVTTDDSTTSLASTGSPVGLGAVLLGLLLVVGGVGLLLVSRRRGAGAGRHRG